MDRQEKYSVLRMFTRARTPAKQAIVSPLKAAGERTCPWCRMQLADAGRLQSHLTLLHPQAAEYHALRRRTGA